MYMRKIDYEQQKILDEFFEEENTWFPDNVLYNFIAIMLICISMVIILFPYNSWNGDRDFMTTTIIMYAMYNYGIFFMTAKYSRYRELGNKQKNIVELLKYMPVDKRQLVYYKQSKIIKPCGLITASVIVVHIIASLAVYGNINVLDVVIPWVLCFLFPILVEYV